MCVLSLSLYVCVPQLCSYVYIHARSLSNLFNTLPRQSALRLPVIKTLLELASSNDGLHALQVSRSDAEKWLKEWDITPAEKSAFLKTLVDVFTKAGHPYVPPLRFPPHLHLLNHARAETRPITTNSSTSAR